MRLRTGEFNLRADRAIGVEEEVEDSKEAEKCEWIIFSILETDRNEKCSPEK